MIWSESKIALVAFGSMVCTAEGVRDALKEKGYPCSLINARFAKPIDEETILSLTKDHEMIVTMEENVGSGGFGEKVRDLLDESGFTGKLINICIPDEYVEHGNVEILKKEIGIDKESIVERILNKL